MQMRIMTAARQGTLCGLAYLGFMRLVGNPVPPHIELYSAAAVAAALCVLFYVRPGSVPKA